MMRPEPKIDEPDFSRNSKVSDTVSIILAITIAVVILSLVLTVCYLAIESWS